MTSVASPLWLGAVHDEARALFHRAREAGVSSLRALVLGQVASFRDCWTFRKNIAQKVGCSVRTVARAFRQGKELGLIAVHRAKPNEIPTGLETPVPCGWSHRFTVGWGQVGKRIQQAIELARATRIVRQAAKAAAVRPAVYVKGPTATNERAAPRTQYQRRNWTAQQLDAELALLERERLNKPPPD